jgi:two-component system chemotaxis response regulator CheY
MVRRRLKPRRLALENNTPYELICMDIKMPGMDGQAALAEIRRLESAHGIEPATARA